jgi:transcriptional regulator with XRE-family HTH domain
MALAKRVGCSTTLIGNIETLKRFPSAENMDRIADALEVPVYELFMKDSKAVERAVSMLEVRERLEQKVLKAIKGGNTVDGARMLQYVGTCCQEPTLRNTRSPYREEPSRADLRPN